MDIETIRKQAEKEIQEEDFRRAVDKCKEKIRRRKNLWNRVFPWRIVIIRRDADYVRH